MNSGNSAVLRRDESVLKGRAALVIGGSGGIGKAVVQCLSSRGVAVTIHGRSERKARELAQSIIDAGGTAFPFIHEISDLEQFMAAVRTLRQPGGMLRQGEKPCAAQFDIVVVAYGPFIQKPLAAHTDADWEEMALMNLALPGALASHFMPSMMERHFGRFLFFGGTRTDSIRAYRSNAAYAAAKTGLGVLVKSIAAEGATADVAAVAVCPGVVDTEYLTGERRTSAERSVLGARLLSPAGIAETAVCLVDSEPCIASGAIVSLDAGLTSWN
ncbi:MAG: SDR family oxidoreductase [Spirochaetaceae bacterium]|nr:SDR family oxidoreductase [Spirochaetaceae bacterium]